MCEATTAIAITGLALSAIGTGVAAYSSYEQQKSANAAADYNAKIQERNAENANVQANQVIELGKVEEAQHRLQVAKLKGTQRATGAGSGLLIDQGSNLQITQDTEGFGELDALTIRANAARTAWGVRNESADSMAQANLTRMKKSSPALAAGSSLLAGGSQLAGQYTSYKKSGVF
jgi:hypothetical protein